MFTHYLDKIFEIIMYTVKTAVKILQSISKSEVRIVVYLDFIAVNIFNGNS